VYVHCQTGVKCLDAYAVEHAGNAAKLPGHARVPSEDVDNRQQLVDYSGDTTDATEHSIVVDTVVSRATSVSRTLTHTTHCPRVDFRVILCHIRS